MKKTIVQFRVSDSEKQMLETLCSKFGCNISELLREWIRNNFNKAFPPYAVSGKAKSGPAGVPKELVVNLTPEQQCERFGGKVGIRNGERKAIFSRPGLNKGEGLEIATSLDNVDGFEAIARRLGLIP